MTDMRAAERLLEVIDETSTMLGTLGVGSLNGMVLAGNADDLPAVTKTIREMAGVLTAASTELRRRGDTIVRRDDLRRVLESMAPQTINPSVIDSLTRLEIALGGKLR